jgi:hypothetical protein
MTLLSQIQSEAVDGGSDIGTLLRRCRVLAQRLGVEEFKTWVVNELEGYPNDLGLPNYRIIKTPLILGAFMGPFGSRIENAQIPISSIPERMREFLLFLKIQQGIGSVAQMTEGSRQVIRVPWSADVLRFIGQGDIYEGYNLAQAVRIVPHASIQELIDQVRNRVLIFALELESLNPKAGEPMTEINKGTTQKVKTIFNTIIKGSVQNLAQNSESFSQTSHIGIPKGDFEALSSKLKECGVEVKDLKSLKTAISKDEVSGEQKLGEKVSAWIGSMMIKASSGIGSVGSKVATSVIADSVKEYFGL